MKINGEQIKRRQSKKQMPNDPLSVRHNVRLNVQKYGIYMYEVICNATDNVVGYANITTEMEYDHLDKLLLDPETINPTEITSES